MSTFCSKMVNFLFSAYFGGHFVTIEMVKAKLISDLYPWDIVLLNKQEHFGQKQYLFFSLIVGPK